MATRDSLSRTSSAAASASASDVVRRDEASNTNARAPTSHAASHHGGSDPVTPAGIGAQPLDADLTTIAGLTATTDNVIQSVSSAWASRTPAQLKATLALAKSDVGLGNVDNTSDVNKPVSTATQTALNAKLDSTAAAGGDLTGNYPNPQIATNTIVNSDLATVATATFKGRTTAGTGNVEDLTATQATALLNTATTALKGLMSTADKKRMGQVYDAQADFGFVGDLQSTLGTSAVTGTALTDSTNPFTAADVGKRVTVPRAGAGSGVNIAQLTTTISAFVNSGQVTLTTGATNNVTSASIHWGTDNSTAEALMVSTINGLAWSGARIVFGNSATNNYGVQTNWVFNKTCWIEGIGGGWTADAGTLQMIGGTRLVWWGTSSDGGTPFQAMITFTPTGANNLKRVTLRNLWLDCYNNGQNQALYGLKLASCPGHRLENVYVMDALAQGIWTDIDTDPTEAKDTTRFIHQSMCFRQLDPTSGANTTPTTTSSALAWSTSGQSMTIAAANSLRTSGYVWVMSQLGWPILVFYSGGGGTTTLTGCRVSAEDAAYGAASYSNAFVVEATPADGGAYKFSGASGANTCLGVVDMVHISHGTTWGPAAIEFLNSDSMELRQVVINGGNATVEANSNRNRKPGVRFNGNNTSAGLSARSNIFYDGDPGVGGVSSMGLNNTGSSHSFPAAPNKWYNMQLGNAAPVPTVEGSSQFLWTGNGMLNVGEHGVPTLTTTTASATSAIIARIQIPPQGLQIGLTVRCRFTMTKTAAGTAARTTGVKLGTAGTTADTTVNSVSRTPTAAADEGTEEIVWAVTGPLGATCTSVMTSSLTKASTTAGLMNVAGCFDVTAGTPVTFNSAGGQIWLSFFITTGTSEVVTILPPVIVEVLKGANP